MRISCVVLCRIPDERLTCRGARSIQNRLGDVQVQRPTAATRDRPEAVPDMRPTLPALLVLAVVGAVGCGGASTSEHAPGAQRGTLTTADSAAREQQARARLASTEWKTDFAKHAVPLSEFQDGGPPRDGIPPIDEPRVGDLAAGDRFLSGREPVILVEAGGRARAYPEQILIWHEIANDDLGGRPIAVTYCPLCNSAVAMDRRVGGRTLTFGTTGKLRNSDLVMWDRQTESWWQQLTGTALVGRLTGARLRLIDAQVVSWSQFKAAHPDGTVLLRPEGVDRPYGSNPYVGYDQDAAQRPFLYDGEVDRRLKPLERVVAVSSGDDTVVIPFSALAKQPVRAATVGGRVLVVLHARGVTSALDEERIAGSRDVGAVGVFDPRIDGRTLRFARTGDGEFRDQDGTTWDVTGRATEGPLRGRRLRPVRHDVQFWFALAAFLPHARVLR
ncbi:MAG: DUF3179 domain-containing protein [Candidatus Nanopelagicales bacterium]